MSRSNNTSTINPTTRWFEWSGSTGQLKYYDRDKGENIFIELPFRFLVLDQLSTVTGYSDETQSGIWANEVRDLRLEPLTVRTKQGTIGTGLYDTVKSLKGVRFTKSIYIAYYGDEGELLIGNLKATGASLSAWIEFSRGKNVYDGAVSLTKSVQAKKGATKYFIPVFEVVDKITEDTNSKAVELDKKLQRYLNEYLAFEPVEQEVGSFTAPPSSPFNGIDQDDQEGDDDIPF